MGQNIQNWKNNRNTTSEAKLLLSNVIDADHQLFVYKQRPFFITFMGFNWCSS